MAYYKFKSFADRSFALIALFALTPLLIAIYFAIFLDLGSPVIFIQLRPGFRTKPFPLLKFRTMTSECSSNGAFLPDCQRLTRFGSWLRTTSIDELPGLINILRGEMSFIGPRPLLMQYLPLYSPEQARRHDVKPGFSGWAQINGRNTISWEKKFQLDTWYVDHQSFLLDLRIFWLTIIKVIQRQGVEPNAGKAMPAFVGNNEQVDKLK